MKSIIGFVIAIVLSGAGAEIPTNLHQVVKQTSLAKVDQGLGSLMIFTQQMNKK